MFTRLCPKWFYETHTNKKHSFFLWLWIFFIVERRVSKDFTCYILGLMSQPLCHSWRIPMTPSLSYISAFTTPHMLFIYSQDFRSAQPCIIFVNDSFLPRNTPSWTLIQMETTRDFSALLPWLFLFHSSHYFCFLYKMFSFHLLIFLSSQWIDSFKEYGTLDKVFFFLVLFFQRSWEVLLHSLLASDVTDKISGI